MEVDWKTSTLRVDREIAAAEEHLKSISRAKSQMKSIKEGSSLSVPDSRKSPNSVSRTPGTPGAGPYEFMEEPEGSTISTETSISVAQNDRQWHHLFHGEIERIVKSEVNRAFAENRIDRAATCRCDTAVQRVEDTLVILSSAASSISALQTLTNQHSDSITTLLSNHHDQHTAMASQDKLFAQMEARFASLENMVDELRGSMSSNQMNSAQKCEVLASDCRQMSDALLKHMADTSPAKIEGIARNLLDHEVKQLRWEMANTDRKSVV